MTGTPESPDGVRGDSRSAPADLDRPRSGLVIELALVAAGLGLVIHLLGYVEDIGLRAYLAGPLLLGGGLLAGSVALPTVRVSVLVPSAVATLTGALFLLQSVVNGSASAVAVGGVVLALLEAAAATGAALLHAGVVRARPRARKAAAPPAGYPPPPGFPAFPGQQYPGQPFPGSYPGHPAEPYAGEHAYAQYARYGTSYGVPGYPPPPPHAAPGYDPTTVPGAVGHGGAERPATPVHGVPVADQPTTANPAGAVVPPHPDPAGGGAGPTGSHAGVPGAAGGAADDRAAGDDARAPAVPRRPEDG
jgi:Family of unknown function (DUF5336)